MKKERSRAGKDGAGKMQLAIRERLSALAQGVVTGMGFELYHLDYQQAGGRAVVRLYVDREGGIRLDDCEAVSRRLGPLLDAEDIVPTSYVLEVSSPGLDRPLFREEDYERFAGHAARVTLFEPVDGHRRFAGRIVSCAGGLLQLALPDGKQLVLPFSKVATGRLELEL